MISLISFGIFSSQRKDLIDNLVLVKKQFGHAALCLPMVTGDDIFREVAAENCNYGVVPVENSTEGVGKNKD